MRKRTSVVWQMEDNAFIELIKNSISMSQVLRFFGMENKGSNYQTCWKRIEFLGLDTKHFLSRVNSSNLTRKNTKDDFLRKLEENSIQNRRHIKTNLIKFQLLDYKCEKCGNFGEWQGNKLSLQLEHKNGVSNDNRLENLAFLCPNCHSQTPSFAGKRHKKYKIKPSQLNPNWRHSPKISNRKFIRPSKEELESLLKTKNILQIKKLIGVGSDNTIRKWAKYYNLDWKNISPFSHVNKQKKKLDT